MSNGLLEREIAFLDALRVAGINVSLAEVLDSTRAMGAIDLLDGEPPDPSVLRDLLRQLLLEGDEDRMRRFARQVVNDLGRADSQPGRQSWFSYRVLRQLSPETLMASLLEALLAGQERGGLAERVARQTISQRIRPFQGMVESEGRR